MTSVAQWPATVKAFPDYFVVSIVRALNRDEQCVASTPDGADSAKAWIETFGLGRGEDIRKLIRKKNLQAMVYLRNWERRYPDASDEASRVGMEIASDILGMEWVQSWAHWFTKASGEYVMLQVWLPSDPDDAMPIACVQCKVGDARSRILQNRDRQENAAKFCDELNPMGYAMLSDPIVESAGFETDVGDTVLQIVSRVTLQTEVTDFGTGLYQ